MLKEVDNVFVFVLNGNPSVEGGRANKPFHGFFQIFI